MLSEFNLCYSTFTQPLLVTAQEERKEGWNEHKNSWNYLNKIFWLTRWVRKTGWLTEQSNELQLVLCVQPWVRKWVAMETVVCLPLSSVARRVETAGLLSEMIYWLVQWWSCQINCCNLCPCPYWPHANTVSPTFSRARFNHFLPRSLLLLSSPWTLRGLSWIKMAWQAHC